VFTHTGEIESIRSPASDRAVRSEPVSEQHAQGRTTMVNADSAPQPNATAGQMFADTGTLSEYVNKWTTATESIRKDGDQIRTVGGCMCSPTADAVTSGYFDALTNTFTGFADHNSMVRDYVEGYAKQLAASRDSMRATEASNAATLRQQG
jgi:hypothetical protein